MEAPIDIYSEFIYYGGKIFMSDVLVHMFGSLKVSLVKQMLGGGGNAGDFPSPRC